LDRDRGSVATATGRATIAALSPFAGPPQATVLGRRDRIDVLDAALLNGMTSHTFDFDDTHLVTVIHPTGTWSPAPGNSDRLTR
jgi:2-methylcitrate dehydratase PrpD